VQYADRIVAIDAATGSVRDGGAREVMIASPVAPPVVRLGRQAGWSPLPLSVRDARAAAAPLRESLADRTPPIPAIVRGERFASVRRLVVGYDGVPALAGIDLDVHAGEIVAVMGRNGAGKSTLLGALAGLLPASAGVVDVSGAAPASLSAADVVRRVVLVPQNPGDLLWRDKVRLECDDADADAQADRGSTAAVLGQLAPGLDGDAHPRDLSEGQRLAVALAVVLVRKPPLVLLDEPTRGLDYPAKDRLADILRDLAAGGHAVVFATHDVELVAELATRVVVLADGEIVSDGPTASVVTASPAFAPQVAKILAPGPWLTVRQVTEALAI
jgi:energy-coupling factor transport system ATP-binding protein